jgi:hypothetical protein
MQDFLTTKMKTQRLNQDYRPKNMACELPLVGPFGHQIVNFNACVSYFEPSWGIDALIGLDFFRYFRVTIDFEQGVIITSPYK